MLLTGAKAPQVTLTNLSGGQETLANLRAQGTLLLAFYKGGCPVCQLTLPFLERLAGKLPVILISQDDPATTERFRRRFGITLPALLDREQDGYPSSNAFGITTVPSLFLIEPDGAISMAGSGFRKADLEALGRRAGVTIFHQDENVPEWKAG
jgi:peroxiredoxin